MFEMRLKASADKSVLAEITSAIDVDTPEIYQHGIQTKRVFVPAGEKVTVEIGPGDSIECGEFTPDYKTLQELVDGEDAKRVLEAEQMHAERVDAAIMPELADVKLEVAN